MRADVYLTLYGGVGSRTRAQRLIAQGCVQIDGCQPERPSTPIDETVPHKIDIKDTLPFVGRGGLKLDGALEAFRIDCHGKRALDIGASTGGFTDCLLQRGAELVFAVDSGEGQLAPSLRENARVINIEGCNARYLCAPMLGARFPAEGVDLIVMDVSFISQTFVLPVFPTLLGDDGEAVTLIKPQFEVGRAAVGKGGIVRDARARRDAIVRVLESAVMLGLCPVGLIRSPIEGGDGNTEYLVHLKKMPCESDQIASLLRTVQI